MKLTVKMKCWDSVDESWFETKTFEGLSYYDIDEQIYAANWMGYMCRVEDYEILEAAE
jgi:hypothetical protein